MDFISFLHSFVSHPFSARKATALFFRAAGLFACFFFLFSDAKMIYLSFNGNGWRGFWIGFFNVLVVNAVFLAVFHASLCPSRKLRPFVLFVGTLLSCNAAYYAVVRQSLFDKETVVLQPFLYLLPLVSTAIILYITQKSKIGNLNQLFTYNLYLSIGTIYVLMYPLFPLNRSFQIWNQFNIIIICLLAACQAHRKQNHVSIDS